MILWFTRAAPADPLQNGTSSQPAFPATDTKAPAKEVAAASRTLTVGTFNARDCAIIDKKTQQREAFHDEIALVAKNAGIDVLALQEVQEDGKPGGDITALSFALAKAGWAMPYNAVLDTGSQDDLAIFSRYRITSQRPIVNPADHGSWPRPALLVTIDAEGKELIVVDMHLKAYADSSSLQKRQSQAKAVADFVRSEFGSGTSSALVVLAGDMNTVSVGDRSRVGGGMSTLGSLQLRDDADAGNDFFAVNEALLPATPTYDHDSHRSVIDHLILSPAAHAAYIPGSVRVYSNDPLVDMRAISDHYPVTLKLGF